ncbi:hypothetical protein ABT246_38015 [Streptomyces sp. NPDC001553]|uniref:hypothetical protein n=1 Tax=Streptomyces sp. NPDC001553 TaxID=3154385 RepID=UPI00331F80E4
MLLQPLQAIRETWSARIHDFLEPEEGEIYKRCVRVALADPLTARLLNTRPGTGVFEIMAELNRSESRSYAIRLTSQDVHTDFEQARARLEETEDKHDQATQQTTWNWRAVTALTGVGFGVGLMLLGPIAILICPMLLIASQIRTTSIPLVNLQHCLNAARYKCLWLVHRVNLGVRAAEWGEALASEGARTSARRLVRFRLGDDPDSLFIPDSDDLLSLRDPKAVIETEARRQLDRKLDHIREGTIALSGPRGSGKTTLLKSTAAKADFGIVVQAPATYTPQEFLLTLSVRLCREYMNHHDIKPPEFSKASGLGRLFERARHRAARLGSWTAFAVPVGVLLALGLSGSVRTLYSRYAHTLAQTARELTDKTNDAVLQIIHGQAVATSVIILILAITYWKIRKETWLPYVVTEAWSIAAFFLALGIIVAVAFSVLADSAGAGIHIDLNPPNLRIDKPTHPATFPLSLGTMAVTLMLTAVWATLRVLKRSNVAFPIGQRDLKNLLGPLTTAAGALLLLKLARNPETHRLLADEQNPLRIAALIAASLLLTGSNWRPRMKEPELVGRCRDHLYRLQTTQSTANGLTTTAQMVGLASTHTTSTTTVPPNFPELVESFRTLLTDIAEAKHTAKQTVVIAIDEVDRLGTATKALAFLGEIKAVLGIPHVHFLISIADDVGASFVRRGLPHRDVTDSSLDDILHVQPATLDESQEIFSERFGLMSPYATFAHSLSGGSLRDLDRYAHQIKEMQAKSESHELTDISRHLILEELSETLAGFRTLLSRHQWNPDTSGILDAFRTLGGYLRNPDTSSEPALRTSLEQFAFSATPEPTNLATPQVGQLTAEAGQLIDEASAYVYFSLTLLDIFSTGGLDRRRQHAAEQGPDGNPERLAEARQELTISPYSARSLIDNIRKAWSLAQGPSVHIRIPRTRNHPPATG